MLEQTECCSLPRFSIKKQKTRTFIENEARKRGCTKTAVVNEYLELLAEFPVYFSTADDSKLEELSLIMQLVSDPVMAGIPERAKATRRDRLRMVLFLLDQSLRTVESGLSLPKTDCYLSTPAACSGIFTD